jgi:tetratricopeptide (TPR) repeat protein
MYRSLLAGRRVLVVLDNAADAGQVRALLPASPGCLALVTSRGMLTGLAVAEGARLLPLDLLTAAEARELLALRLGEERLAAEPEAVAALIELTAGLPLALAVVAARAHVHAASPLGVLAAELRDARGRLDLLAAGEVTADVRAAFSWSYRRLAEPAARLFRLLSVHPGPDVTAAAAASLAGVPAAQARRALAELTAGGLLAESAPGRYRGHDLARSYARELSHAQDDGAARRAATARMLDHYLHTAHAANRLISADPQPLALPAHHGGVLPEELETPAHALAWFAAEQQVLHAVIAHAAATGADVYAWMLPAAVVSYLSRSGRWHEWAAVQQTALAAAQRLGDRRAQARVHHWLGYFLALLRQGEQARAHLEEAMRLCRGLGDVTGEALTHLNVAVLLDVEERHRESLVHACEALRLLEQTGNRLGQAMALNMAGWVHIQLGDCEQAVDYCQRSLALRQETGNQAVAADTWDSLGLAYDKLGRSAASIGAYEQAIGQYRRLGHRPGEGGTLARLGDAQHRAGDLAAAAASWRRALGILTEVHHPDAAAVAAKLTATSAGL